MSKEIQRLTLTVNQPFKATKEARRRVLMPEYLGSIFCFEAFSRLDCTSENWDNKCVSSESLGFFDLCEAKTRLRVAAKRV